MKFFILYISIVFLFLSCEKPGDCLKSTGTMTSKQIEVPAFDKIRVNKGIGLVVTQGSEYKVEVRTGENLINDIKIKVIGDLLTIQDNTSCNWVRDYGQTIVYITAPNLTEIHSKTEQNIVSNGLITYPNLLLTAMDDNDGSAGAGTGDFVFQVNNDNLILESNNVSRFTIIGQTNNLSLHAWEGNGIMDTQNLASKDIKLYHRGSNDMFIHPILSISGDIYNVGNVYCYSKPLDENIHVNQHYQGRLFFY